MIEFYNRYLAALAAGIPQDIPFVTTWLPIVVLIGNLVAFYFAFTGTVLGWTIIGIRNTGAGNVMFTVKGTSARIAGIVWLVLSLVIFF